MRLLAIAILATTLGGCLWDTDPPQTPPVECAATTNPKECNKAFRR